MDHYTSTEIVTALYEALLMRAPDAEGLKAAVAMHDACQWTSLSASIKHMLQSREFATQQVNFLQRYVKDGLGRFTNDVSQYGEVGLLIKHIVNASSSTRIVVDAGARGRARSNSFDLLRHFGWRGLLIEANPSLIEQISEEFSGLNFVLLNCAVSDYTGTAKFYLGANDDVSSLGRVDRFNQHQPARKTDDG